MKELKLSFDPGFGIHPTVDPLGYVFDEGVFGPVPECRHLDDIRSSLSDPKAAGPDVLYAIVMDVGSEEDKQDIIDHHLVYGSVTYATGQIGDAPIHSQGHIHAVSASCGMSTGELYEIWSGHACIYMQERAEDNPGRCYAIEGGPGDLILVPPYWAHCTVVTDLHETFSFGCWSVRDYGFEYRDVRAHHGMAYMPYVEGDQVVFKANPRYQSQGLIRRKPRHYDELKVEAGKPIYTQFKEDPGRFDFISRPQNYMHVWEDYEP
jgi:glucose-6-phosphate isomerase